MPYTFFGAQRRRGPTRPRAPQAPPVSITRGFAQAPHSAQPFSCPSGLAPRPFTCDQLHGMCQTPLRSPFSELGRISAAFGSSCRRSNSTTLETTIEELPKFRGVPALRPRPRVAEISPKIPELPDNPARTDAGPPRLDPCDCLNGPRCARGPALAAPRPRRSWPDRPDLGWIRDARPHLPARPRRLRARAGERA